MTSQPVPDSPDDAVARAFAEVEAARVAAEKALADEGQATGSSLVLRGGDAVAVKAQAAELHRRATTARAELAAAQQRVQAAVRAQQEALEARLREQMALLAPLEEKIKQAREAIWTVNLYLGRDETIVRLAEGAPAPADTPLVLRQQVLAMDEETGARAATGGMDVTNIDEFDDWITSDPAHLTQVLPEPRGVVAIMARRSKKDYGDPFTSAALNEANQETWFLIRNGDNLYRMITDFNVGQRLIPLRTEFTDLFIDRLTRERLEPGSRAWMKAEKAQGARERHYMRVALILQGLLDRTTVFHPLPTPPLSLLGPADYDTGRVVLRTDDEHALTTGRLPFYSWLRAKNSLITTGMRVLIAAGHQDWPSRGRERHNYDMHERLSPPRAETPDRGPHTLVRRGDRPGSFVFTYERTREEWIRNEWGREELRVPKTKASCWITTEDKFVLPIDLVTIAEMREYLDARTERHAYADMFPTLREAIAFKEAEAATEAPFRTMLAGKIAQAEDIDLDTAREYLDEMVDWWKIGNRWHRPLSGDPQAEAKATRAILTERARRARANSAADVDLDAQFTARIRREHPDVLLIGRRKNGDYVALTPTPRRWARPTTKERNHWGDQIGPVNVYVTRREYTARGAAKTATDWVLPTPTQVSRWIILFEGEQWATWDKTARAADHLTDPEIETILDQIRTTPAPDGHTLVAVTYREHTTEWDTRTRFTAYYQPIQIPSTPARPLTDGVEHLYMATRLWFWKRNPDGSVTAMTDGHGDGHHNNWDVTHNILLDGQTLGTVRPPWASDRRANHIIWTDAKALAAAQIQANTWNQIRQGIAVQNAEANRLVRSIEDAWIERARTQAHDRFIEDYGDETLWPAHEKTLTFTVPWEARYDRTPKEYRTTGAALTWLTKRLIETGRPPYEQTVGEALAVLGEPLHEPSNHAYRGSRGGRAITLPDDVLDLRFPAGRPQLDSTSEEATTIR